jgi:hypothetical protein
VRTEPLVLVQGTLERHAAAGGAINVLVKRLVPLDAADLRTERPAATVKDFSPLDERERQRILEEQPLVAVGGGGAESAAPMPGAGRIAALAAVASSRAEAGRRETDGGAARTGAPSSGGAAASGVAGTAGLARGANPNEPAEAPKRGAGGATTLSLADGRRASDDRPPDNPAPDEHAGGPDGEGSENPVRERGGSEDFRAVAPPVMSFAQGRRR